MIKQCVMVLLVCHLLSGCNQQSSNPLNNMPARQAASLILKATKIANDKTALPLNGDNYFTCLKQQYDEQRCNTFYAIMATVLQNNGVKVTEMQLAQFKPSSELIREVEYQSLIDDEV